MGVNMAATIFGALKKPPCPALFRDCVPKAKIAKKNTIIAKADSAFHVIILHEFSLFVARSCRTKK